MEISRFFAMVQLPFPVGPHVKANTFTELTFAIIPEPRPSVKAFSFTQFQKVCCEKPFLFVVFEQAAPLLPAFPADFLCKLLCLLFRQRILRKGYSMSFLHYRAGFHRLSTKERQK